MKVLIWSILFIECFWAGKWKRNIPLHLLCQYKLPVFDIKKTILFLLLFVSLICRATNYYSATGGGDATLLTNWWTANNNTGAHPANFTTAGDIFIVQSSMTTSTTWTVAGTIQVNSSSFTVSKNVSVMNMTIGGGTLTLSGAGINITTGGAWAYNSGAFTPGNNAANIVSFGSSTTIGGTLPTTFAFLTINTSLSTDTVTLLTSGCTVDNNSGGGILTLNTGIFKIGANNTLNFASGGGGMGIVNPNATGTSNFATNGTNGANGGTINVIPGNTFTVSGTGATTFYNLYFTTNAKFVNSNTATLINDTLNIPNNNWSITTNSPIYGPKSTLLVNTTGQAYTPGLEWTSSTNPTVGTTPGYPNNVIIVNTSGTIAGGPTGGSYGLAGNLTLNGGEFDLANMGSNTFTVGGNVLLNSGTLKASATGNINVAGNWTRVSGATFNPNGGTVDFIGNGTSVSPQIITGPAGGENEFNNVTIGSVATGSTYVNLASPVTLPATGSLTLTSGIVQTSSTNLLTVSNTATTAVSGGSSSNYINGPLAWKLAATSTNSYAFPVGSGTTYIPFTIVPNSTSSTIATIQAFASNSNGHPDNTTVTSLSNTEYWSLSTSTNFTSGASISVVRPSSVAPYNVIAKSTTANGIYSSVGGTVSGDSINNSNNIGTSSPVYFAIAIGPLSLQTVSITNPSCDGTVSGSVTVQGSSGMAPYMYKIGSGSYGTATSGSATFTGLTAGTYVITVEDANTPTPETATDTVVVLPPLTVTADTTINACTTSSVQLLATSSSGGPYTWTPATGLSSTTIANPIATVSSTTKYYVSTSVNNPNLIQNPGFESGSASIGTDYSNLTTGLPYVTAPSNASHNGYYTIVGNANNMCSGFDNFPAHSGSSMMIVDGPDLANTSTDSSSRIWSQTVSGLSTNTNYTFSYWQRSADLITPPSILAQINGVNAGGTSSNPSLTVDGSWTQVVYSWNSGTSTSATIDLYDVGPFTDNGNDFALDDINFNSICQQLDSVTITVMPCVKFGQYATAPYFDMCSANKDSSAFYNTTGSGSNLIGNSSFTGSNLGSYIQNSHTLKLNGGEVKTFKNTGANVCGATLYYTIYPQGSRPATPVFTPINLLLFDACSGGSFPTGGSCSTGDQKWQLINQNVDLTAMVPATYTLEIYYMVVGDSSSTSLCRDTVYTNNSGSNYVANYTITTLPTINYSASSFCTMITTPQTVTLTGTTSGTYSASPNGLTINTASGTITPSSSGTGNYTITYHFNDVNGCADSTTTIVAINKSTTSTTNTSICPSAFPYSWNGNSYTIAGTYSVTLTNAVGCDSVATLILTKKATSTSTTNTSICPSAFPYSWNGNSYTIAGTYSVTLTNSVGCDSVATLILTQKITSTSTTNTSICPSAFPYSWNGNSYTIAGTYSVTLTNSVGCDSVATLILTKKATSTSTTNTSICPSAFPYSWNGNSYTIAGTYSVTLTNSVGCDSVATLILTQKTTSTSTTNTSICPSAFPYSWNGNSYSIAGTYSVTLTNAVGCDSIATLILTQKATSTSTTNTSICPSAFPYSWNGNSYPIAGTYSVTLTNALGCDSVATLILTKKATSTSITNTSICPSAFPYSWNGNSYPIAGTYSVTLTNSVGCDSIATLILTQKATSTSTTNTSICPSAFPYNWNGNSYPIAGTYSVTLTNSVGCDSIATLILTQKATSTSTTNTSICPSAFPYSWNGDSYPIAGTYSVTLTNSVGCDSVATLILTQKTTSTSTTNTSICPSAFPYSWNGNSYTIAGTYSVTLTNALGCDSVATLILTKKATSTSITNTSICPSAFPYSWNGNSYPIAGTYSVTLTNSVGCDSIATLILTQKATSTSTTNTSICPSAFPYNWNGNSYPIAGTYSVTLTNSVGCDSIATLILTQKATSTSTTNTSICPSAFPYSWNGDSYPIAGTYSVTLTNSVGCDSVATLILTQKTTSTSTTNTSICPSAFPYSWNGNSYTIAGTYSVTLTNALGCDSVATLILTQKATSTSTTNTSICPSAFPYSWNGNSYTIAGTYSVTLTNSVGCDSVATLILTQKATSTSTTNTSICPSAFPYSWNGNSYPIAGTYSVTLTNSVGCDSIATLNLTQNATSTSTTNISICTSAFPYSWNGNSYPIAGTYSVTLTNSVGCDSIATLILTQKATSTSITNTSICPSAFPYNWNGNSYPIAGTYSVTLTSSVGCDSVATLNLTQKTTSTSTTNTSICPSAFPYSWNGNSYPIAGTYSVTLTNSVGCDSIATLILTQKATSTSTTNTNICPSAFPYSWNGNSYPIAGTYSVILTNSVGCDSVATLILTKKATSTSTTNTSICPSAFPYSWNGNSYPIAGTYSVTLTNSVGCDSIATLILTQKATSTSTTNTSVCPSAFPYSWNGNSYPIAGTYSVTLTNALGCDSVATLILTKKATSTSITNISICPAQLPYTWNTNSYTIAGSYSVILTNTAGCDSIATLNLTVNATVASSTTINICPAQLPYLWNGNSYTGAGSYTVTLTNVAGCDSIVTLNLAINPAVTSSINISVCPSQLPYLWNGNNYTLAGSYNVTLTNIAGCDSIVTLNLTIKTTSTSTTNISICPSAFPYSWNGNSYPIAGTYSVTLTNSVGCDSVATLNLTQNTTSTSTTNTSICPSAFPYNWNGNAYPIAGTYSITLTNSAGCDSVATLILTQKATSTSTTNTSICPSAFPYSWNGNSYPIAGTYSVTLTNSVGCDSVATLILTQKATSTSTTNTSICPSAFPYSWNGNSYPIAGTYSVTLTNSVGCDSIATLNLTQKTTSTSITNTSICLSAFPYSWNGNSYTIAGIYSITLTNYIGCDSVATLNLTQNATSTSITNVSICPSQLPYLWNGNNYSTAGSFNITLTNVAGCDSIATLNLTVNPTVTSTSAISICPAQLPYFWNGQSYTTAGSYNVTLTNIAGCDSIATLTLSILTGPVTQTTRLQNCNSVVVDGITYTTSTIVHDTLKSLGGCDSIYHITTININPITRVTNNTVLNNCSSIIFKGITYSTSAIIRDTIRSVGGCDSIYNIATIHINPITPVTNNTVLNNCSSITFNGITYTASTILRNTFKSIGECDSIYNIISININPIIPVTVHDTITGCNDVVLNGVAYSTSTSFETTIQSIGGCDSVYSVTNIIINPTKFDLTLTSSANNVNKGTIVNIVSGANAPYTVIEWEPTALFPSQNTFNQELEIDSTTHIMITAKSSTGCEASASVVVNIKGPTDFYVPNAFTPNADGRNDYFRVYGTNINHGVLRIYNQWGQLLFETTDIETGWNGYYKGVMQPIGVYAYTVVAVMNDGSQNTAHGFFNLIR